MGMKKYNNYKNSGIEWIGEIPEHWNAKRLKNIGNLFSGLSGKSGTDFSPEATLTTKPFINFTNVANNKYIVLDNFGHVNLDENEKQNLVKKGDLLFLMSSENQEDVGKSSLLNQDYGELYLNSFCKGLRVLDENINPEFLNYLLNSSILSKLVSLEGRGFTRINLRMEGVQNLPIIYPNLQEQTTIDNYLDHKTNQIDTLIAKKQQFISLLQEERIAVINQAVTKGLDPKAKMKDSGIEWLGEIPEHWEVLSFRFCIDVLTDFTSNGSFASLAQNVNYLESGYSRLVRLTDLRIDLKNDGLYVDENAHNFLKNSELFGGEMLIANVGAYAGLVKIMPHIEGKHTLAPNMFLLRLNQNSDFFFHQLNAPFCAEQLKMMAISSAQPKLNKDNMRQLKVVKPSLEEQVFLVKHIEKESLRINDLQFKVEQEIELLKEYKTALISEVVTGKVDVREVVLN